MNNEDMEEWFDENGLDAMAAMSEMIKVQQTMALGLTKLVLHHCVDGKISKNELFELYQEASEVIKAQIQLEEIEG